MTEEMFNECVATLTDGLYRFTVRCVGDGATAEDIVQESFMRMWQSRHKVRPGCHKSYLYTIAYRLAIDVIRSRRFSSDVTLDRISSAGEDGGYDDTGHIVLQAVDRLKPEWKSVILLRHWEGYSYDEIAQIMDITLAQVKIYLFRARTELRHIIGSLDNVV
ncbi:MAG: RNA polymerase sigma factor [Rikenellaceae bacterium]|nr:RNA polymerase sigma factor [Rikenellaceae bacterium]MDE7134390.1 RNA polymerase sigma factor [Rikenellaceae bacterium]MDE7356030.1 RNA polymerase sigma factor [Rikenellaceae bacterium]